MPTIALQTLIHAPMERCFDLSRSIDLHQRSVAHTNEKAIAGVTSGLIGLYDEVTWQAKHFGIVQKLAVRVTEFNRPHHFQDVMIFGAFQKLQHDHYFEQVGSHCRMRDEFDYTSPFGILGILADRLFLEAYMTRLLITRNATIKYVAESEEWRTILPS
jgi:ligand-binding SRPBCC domain-containing protein